MRHEKEHILEACHRLKVGERITIDLRMFRRALPCGWPTIYETSLQALLSSLVGSAWGAYRAQQDPIEGNVTVSRHEPGDRRVYIDPDRAHLFRRTPDGFLELKDDQ